MERNTLDALVELKSARTLLSIKAREGKASQKTIADQAALISNLEQQIMKLHEQIEEHKKIGELDKQTIASFQKSLDDCMKRISKLEGRVRLWKKIAKVGGAAACAAGLAAGYLLFGRN